MLEIYKDHNCLEFYGVYDRFLSNILNHSTFLSYIHKKLDEIESNNDIHKTIIDFFIDYFNSRIIEGNYAMRVLNKMRDPLKRIFDFCYCQYFKVKTTPDNTDDIKKAIHSREKCFELFKGANKYSYRRNFSHCEKVALEEIQFIQALSKYMYDNKNMPVSYFKRFLFIFPLEQKSSTEASDYKEWEERHNEYFEYIKKDKDASEQDLTTAREWFESLLNRADFDNFSEKDKSNFFIEAFVAFGNSTSKKSGGFGSYVTPLKNLLYMGRYYNIHVLPLKYMSWRRKGKKGEKEKKDLAFSAYATWRHFLGKSPYFDLEKIKMKKKSGSSDMAIDEDLFGQRARRFEEEELKKQDSFGGQISAEDLDKANILPTLVNQISLPMIKGFQENKTPIQEALPIMTKHMFTKSGISKFVNKRDLQQDAENIEKNDYKDSQKMIRYAILQSLAIEKKIPFQTTYEITILFQNSTEEVDIKKLTKDLAKEL